MARGDQAVGLAEPQRKSLLMVGREMFSEARGRPDLRARMVAAAREQLAAAEAELARVAGNVRNLRSWLKRQEDLP